MRAKRTSLKSDVHNWWTTSIIDMQPNKISVRGHEIEKLIGTVSFTQMIWLLTTGEFLNNPREKLLEAALVSAVDHGPQAPSVAAARMAISCGVGINNALASGVNMLGDIHGGAGQQSLELYTNIVDRIDHNKDLDGAVTDGLQKWARVHGKYVPGFGHRFHKKQDPRSPRLMELVDQAIVNGDISGRFKKVAQKVEEVLAKEKGRPIPMNIDGSTAVIFAELGCTPTMARGLFCLSRSVGILAHSYEQSQQGERNKGPTPPKYLWKYIG